VLQKRALHPTGDDIQPCKIARLAKCLTISQSLFPHQFSTIVVTLLCSVSTEFLALMKKVAKSPLVMDVLNITNVQRQLERLADLLSKIQKALGEYLERERSSFPRYGTSFHI